MRPSDLSRAALLAGLVFASPLHAGNREFKQLVREMRSQYHKAPIGTGFLGFLARCFSPKGISGLHMAIFDELDAKHQLIGADFEGLVQRSIGPDMAPMVLVRSNRTGERTVIYAKPSGKRTELLIVTADPHDVVVVSLNVDPETLQKWMDDPGRMGKQAHGGKQPEARPDIENGEMGSE